MLDSALEIKTILIKQALIDPSFRAKLLENPRKAIGDELLLELPTEICILAFQDTKNVINVVIPYVDTDLEEEHLQEQELRRIAGGEILEEIQRRWGERKTGHENLGHALKKGAPKPNGSRKRIVEMDQAQLEKALNALGDYLAEHHVHYEVIVIGGASLLLEKLVKRKTRDVDVIAIIKDGQLISADPLPLDLLEAADKVGQDLQLGTEWFCNGASPLLQLGLPAGFMDRVITLKYKGLTVHLANRFDHICFKVYGSVLYGRSKHFFDLIALKPTAEELEQAKKWSFTSFETRANSFLKTLKAFVDSLSKS